MGLKNSSEQFGTVAKYLHWLVAAGILILLFLGIEQSDMERGDARTYIRFIHASLATVVFMLMTARLVWRFVSPPPGHPDGIPGWQRMSTSLVHWGLYICVFVQLSAGAMLTATGGKGLPMFGFFSIWLPVEENHDSHEWWEGIHGFMWRPLAILITLHVLAALYNHFVIKNDVLRRMTIGVK